MTDPNYIGPFGGGGGGGGGSGGAAGGRGGSGVDFNNSGGAGGAALSGPGNGNPGVDGSPNSSQTKGGGGGGGGSGGAHAKTTSDPSFDNTTDLTGFTGGNGGDGGNGGHGGGAGGGGAGGFGLVVTGASRVTNSGMLTIAGGLGGNGGDGGDGFASDGDGGIGGDGGGGGLGIQFTSTGGSLTNAGTILGGAGGLAGHAGTGRRNPGAGGSGGTGGDAFWGSGLTIKNTGTIQGGTGGNSPNPGNCCWDGGNGGNGITGDNLTLTSSGTISGGDGGVTQGYNSQSGSGGDGVSGSGSTIVNNGSISGGAGADNPASTSGTPKAGNGGKGIAGNNLTITNTTTITGGTGGDASNATMGRGGDGGDGIAGDNLNLSNSGMITAGDGGDALLASNMAGAGGNGITGSGLIITNSGTISGGAAGTASVPGAPGNAILVNGGAILLELRAGSTINGNVDATAATSSTLVLGGSADFTFDASRIGRQYLGFQGFEKAGTSTWTLTGAPAGGQTSPWTINGGTLSAASASVLGSGGLTFGTKNGLLGTLHVAGTSTYSETVALNANGTIQTDAELTLSGVISGQGALTKSGQGTLVLTSDNTYAGGTKISAGTLQLGNGGTSGSVAGDISNDGTLTFKRSDNFIYGNVISGSGTVIKEGSNRLTFTTDQTYTGTTTIRSGTLQLGNGGTAGSVAGNIDNQSALVFKRSDDLTYSSVITGSGAVTQAGGGQLTFTADQTYTGATTVSSGTLQLGNGGTSGSVVGEITNNAALVFDRSNALTYGGAIDGSGTITKKSAGTLTLSGNSGGFSGSTSVNAGTLKVGGRLGGIISVASGGTLTGTGTVGGNTEVKNGGTLKGTHGGTLTVSGNLKLDSNANVDVALGAPETTGVFSVGGDLTLDGNLNVTDHGGLSPGYYRLFDYSGSLTDNTLAIGSLPSGFRASDMQVQTDKPNQVNILSRAGAGLNFWDGGGAQNEDNGSVDGDDGTWNIANHNWTIQDGSLNGRWSIDHFAIFSGSAGTVTVDGSGGAIGTHGMQFMVDGYRIEGDAISLEKAETAFRVGAGGAGDTGLTATITSQLTGSGKLKKTDGGTLVLTGNNDYSGGTTITGGTLQLGNGGASGSITGRVQNNGTLVFNRSDSHTFAGAITGSGSLEQAGSGTTVLTGQNTYSGGTKISAGTLQIGNGGTSGTLGAGDIINDGVLVFERSNALTYGGAISGTGTVKQAGSGVTTLTAANSYAGATTISAGTLDIDGDQSGATGRTSVQNGGTLRGDGTVGGDVTVASGGTLTSFDDSADGINKLAINDNLSLASGASVKYEYGLSPNNDHDALMVEVGGDVDLGGATLNVVNNSGVDFDPGVYGLIHYGGALSGNFSAANLPSSDFKTQTSDPGRVNMVNTAGLKLRFWDGNKEANRDNGRIDGGSGMWQAANNDWTTVDGQINGRFTEGSFAIFAGTAGTVTVDDSAGPINVAGMQFVADGYTIKDGTITLVGTSASIVLGDRTPNGREYEATIASVLQGGARLVKEDLGTLILTGDNTYTGGTQIDAGTLQIGKDGNLGAADTALAFDGGTLETTAGFSTTRNVTLKSGGGTFQTDTGTLTLTGTVGGAGSLTKSGSGTLTLTGDNTYSGKATVEAGILAAGAAGAFSAASDYDVRVGGTLDLNDHDQTLASLQNAGNVSLGDIPGTILTVAGDYTGKGGTVSLGTALAGDNSVTDRLHVEGDTAGKTTLVVTNAGGQGAQTDEGIKLVDIDGASNGSFTLAGHYTFKGDPAVVGGAYAYRLFQNTPSAQDGDWYLRSTLEHQKPKPPKPPHYQPGAPVYEAYGQALMEFNAVGTLRERLGSRIWREDNPDMTTAATPLGSAPVTTPAAQNLRLGAVWGRIEAAHGSYDPRHATSSMDYDTDIWKLQAGIDSQLYETGAGDLIGGLFGQYGTVSADVASPHGDGTIDATGYGLGGTLTWFGADGLYLDALAQATWYDSDLSSGTAKRDLARDNDGFGYAFSLEAGKVFTLTPSWSLTPQAQLVYSSVDFDSFTDTFGARVAHKKSESLKGRAGAAIGHHATWRDTNGQAAATHLYGIANLSYEMLDGGAAVDLAGTDFATANDRLWGGVGLGGSYSWADNKYALHGELALDTSLQNFAESYKVTGNVGIKVRW